MQFVGRPGARRGRGAADHVRDRWAPGPDRVDPRRSVRLCRRRPGAGRQRGVTTSARTTSIGAVLDSILLHTRAQSAAAAAPLADRAGPGRVRHQGLANEPDQGIWGRRAASPQHYVSSKLMCWVALDRAAQLAGIRPASPSSRRRSGARPPRTSAPTSSRTGVREQGVLRQHYDTDALDASTLLAALLGLLPRSRRAPAGRAGELAIADDLTEDGFVLRYQAPARPTNGVSGKEGTLPDPARSGSSPALAVVGEAAARTAGPHGAAPAHRLARSASTPRSTTPSTARHLGNVPQAFSHLALIEAAGRLVLDERLKEITG